MVVITIVVVVAVVVSPHLVDVTGGCVNTGAVVVVITTTRVVVLVVWIRVVVVVLGLVVVVICLDVVRGAEVTSAFVVVGSAPDSPPCAVVVVLGDCEVVLMCSSEPEAVVRGAVVTADGRSCAVVRAVVEAVVSAADVAAADVVPLPSEVTAAAVVVVSADAVVRAVVSVVIPMSVETEVVVTGGTSW